MRYVLTLLAAFLSFAFAQDLELHIIDVGQGDSVLIRTPDGQNVLYDGGRDATTALEHLQELGVSSLDVVIASHPDADHIGGLPAVLRAYRPRFYLESPISADSLIYGELQAAVGESVQQEIEPTARRLLLGETTIQIIPTPGDLDFEANGNSVGIVISHGEFRAALTGDATPEEFAYWQETYSELLRPVDVYKSSHHGSDDGDDAASVRAWQPEAVVISVGESNPYGHPTPEALALYESVGATVYRTDQSGTVVVTAEPDGSYTVNLSPSEPRLAAPPLSEPTSSSTTTPDLPYDPQGPDRDCGDFSSQAEAQAFYEAAGGSAQDPHQLDGDGNGVACESLP